MPPIASTGSVRELPGFEAYEFRAGSQPALLDDISSWLKKREGTAPYEFVYEIRLELDEADLAQKDAYRAVVIIDGVQP